VPEEARPRRRAHAASRAALIARALAASAIVGLFGAACAARGFVPPTGATTPLAAPEAEAIWLAATRECAAVEAINVSVRPSGSVGGTGVRGLELFVGLDAAGHVGIEAEGRGQPVFTLKGTTEAATLWLPAERRVVRGRADDILNAIVGLELDAARLRAVLTGCGSAGAAIERADRIGGLVRMSGPDASIVYAEEVDGRWRVRAATADGLTVDYREWDGNWPRTIGLRTAAGRSPAVDLRLRIEDRVLAPDFPPGTFEVVVPADATPAAVGDLRLIGSE
jgi:hypothetical protein